MSRRLLIPPFGVLLAGICLAIGQLFAGASISHAQDTTAAVRAWSEPLNISQSFGDSADPTIVADNTGVVHLFWSEQSGEEVDRRGQRIHGNTLMYSRWENGEWLSPIDVLVSPDDGEIWQPVAAVDKFGILHLVWASAPSGRLYYSHAPAVDAVTARGWSAATQLHIGLPTSALPAGLAVDSEGIVHVIATSRDLGQEVIHLASADGGATWSPATSLSAEMPGLPGDGLVSGGIAMHVDSRDRLHVGWSMYNRDGFGVIVYYTQSDNGGATWSTPFIVGEKAETDYEADWLNIATADDNRVHLVWTGIGFPPGRLYRTSFDGGNTWTPATQFMEGMVGETESPRMVTDSAEIVHLFTPLRTVTTDTGIRYAYSAGPEWTAPFKIPGPPPDPGAYPALRVSATLNLGNQIWVAWYDEPRGEIFVVSGESGAPAIAPVPLVPSPWQSAAVTTAMPAQTELPVPAATATVAIRLDFASTQSSGMPALTSATALLISLAPSVGVVIALLIGVAAARKRRR